MTCSSCKNISSVKHFLKIFICNSAHWREDFYQCFWYGDTWESVVEKQKATGIRHITLWGTLQYLRGTWLWKNNIWGTTSWHSEVKTRRNRPRKESLCCLKSMFTPEVDFYSCGNHYLHCLLLNLLPNFNKNGRKKFFSIRYSGKVPLLSENWYG